jgi:pimeloyl-ACP methyl ester carboxylesterase
MRIQLLIIIALPALLLGLTACGQVETPRFEELKVSADDVTLHVRIAGNPEAGNVLIGIHGGPGNSSDYMISLEQLASAELTVVNYDQRGTGQSTEPSKGYAMDNYVADLEAVRQAVRAESVHLLGHSWGGLVALRYAVTHPQRVRSIILMGSGVLTPQAAQAAQANKAERITALQQQGMIPATLTSMTDILPAYFSDPSFDMPGELENMYYNPRVEQMAWSALGNYDFAAGVDTDEEKTATHRFGTCFATRQLWSASRITDTHRGSTDTNGHYRTDAATNQVSHTNCGSE